MYYYRRILKKKILCPLPSPSGKVIQKATCINEMESIKFKRCSRNEQAINQRLIKEEV